MKMTEKWLPVIGYESTYEVSNYGQVRRSSGGQGCRAGRILTPAIDNLGYARIHLHQHGISRTLKLHRIVAAAFVSNPNNYPEINHKDGVKANNKATNLEWTTRSKNIQHAFDTGLKFPSRSNVKLTDDKVLQIRKLRRDGLTLRALADLFNVGETTISHVVHYHYWTHLP